MVKLVLRKRCLIIYYISGKATVTSLKKVHAFCYSKEYLKCLNYTGLLLWRRVEHLLRLWTGSTYVVTDLLKEHLKVYIFCNFLFLHLVMFLLCLPDKKSLKENMQPICYKLFEFKNVSSSDLFHLCVIFYVAIYLFENNHL